MNISLVLTIIGHDKPGIVEALARTIAATGANWEESRMARLANHFTGILRVTVPEFKVDELAHALRDLSGPSLKIIAERSTPEERPLHRTMRLELVGNDRPGIVRDISRTLAERGVNIEELDTEVVSAPMSGDVLFKAAAQLVAPASLGLDELRRVLEGLANEMMVDVSLDVAE